MLHNLVTVLYKSLNSLAVPTLFFSSSVKVIDEAEVVLFNTRRLFKRSQDFNLAVQIQIVKFK